MNNWSPILGLPRLSLRVAGVVPVNSLWKQAFATALAPACKSGAAALSSHTCAKTVLAFTRTLRWLISAFHNRELAGLRSESAYSRSTASVVNDTEREQFCGATDFMRAAVILDRATGSNLQRCQLGAFLE
jgi:hypothetical protein